MDHHLDHQFVARLIDASTLIQDEQTLDDGLRNLARMAAVSIGADRCSVMLIAENDGERKLRVYSHFGDMPAEAYAEPVALDQGIAGHVASTGESVLVDDIAHSEFAAMARRGAAGAPSLMSAPIKVADQTIGVINVSEPSGGSAFTPRVLELLNVFALFVGKSIQVFELQKLAGSRVLQMAQVLDLREHEGGGPRPICPDPARLAKLVAKNFYRELAAAGFGPNAIIAVSSEVLNELNESLVRHRSRFERLKGGVEAPREPIAP